MQSWYQGGLSVIDWTDGKNRRRSPGSTAGRSTTDRLVLGGYWSTYYYNGQIFGSEIQRGFDVFKLTGEGIGGGRVQDHAR